MSSFPLVLGPPLVACFLLYFIKRYLSNRNVGRRIPGPVGLPIVGNFFDIPREDEPQVFSEWAKTYGASCNPPSHRRRSINTNH